ncbi:MAG: twin-arginine translocase TatA/TatE family subunit [Magnetococcales bacterium]|nr:twin-arginine translocase TatA/TatE family subunit [Magnetococcales bacterium]MBF0262991.1 twin-arginine translocase TatA/TatE family subunit [Magnetococcales bacterium]
MGLGTSHLLIILVIVLVVFGAGKLPSVMRDIGQGVKSFKDAMSGDKDPPTDEPKPEEKIAAASQTIEGQVKKDASA